MSFSITMPPQKRCVAPSFRAIQRARDSAQTMRSAFRLVQSSHCGRNPGSRGRPARSKANEKPLKLEVVTLVEVWTSLSSSWAEAVRRLGGASLRITWPPPCKSGRSRGQKRDFRDKLLRSETLAPDPPPPAPILMCGRVKTWYLNLELASHQEALEKYVHDMKPAQGTNGVHIHTSPMCYPFSHPQHLNLARGVDISEHHAAGVRRLDFARRVHRAHEHRAKSAVGKWTRSHEQPERSSVDFSRRPYNALRDFPWALGELETRSLVRGCAAGLAACVDGTQLPVYKAWVFESDNEALHMALRPLRWCRRDHSHAQTIPGRVEEGQAPVARASVKASEKYPFFLGCVLGVGICYAPANT